MSKYFANDLESVGEEEAWKKGGIQALSRIRVHVEEMAEMYEASSIVVLAEYRGAARAMRELLRWLDEEAP